MDSRSPRRRRLRPDSAAVQVNDLPAYCEAEARAAGAGIGHAALRKLIEDRFPLCLRNSDAIVRNGAMQRRTAAAHVSVRYCHLNHVLSRGEFDRVGEKIDEDLHQSLCVKEAARISALALDDKFKLLGFKKRAELCLRLPDNLHKVTARRMQFELSRLEFGQVEKRVQQFEKA